MGRVAIEQFGVQALGVGATIGFCALATLILMVVVDKTVGIRLGASGEMAGMDHELHGEQGYGLLNLN
jgi:Amt family ammonium transporter